MSYNLLLTQDMWNGGKLEKLRAERGISARDLAKKLGGVSNTTVGRWLTGESVPDFSQAVKLAQFFGVSLDCFSSEPTGVQAGPPDLTPDEASVIDLYRALGLSRYEALRRLASQGVAVEPVGPVQPVQRFRALNRQDLSEQARREQQEQLERAEQERKEEKRRLGFKDESECGDAPGNSHLDPFARRRS